MVVDGHGITTAPFGGKKHRPESDRQGEIRNEAQRACRRGRSALAVVVAVAGANKDDMKLIEPTLQNIVVERPHSTKAHPRNTCMERGYDLGGRARCGVGIRGPHRGEKCRPVEKEEDTRL